MRKDRLPLALGEDEMVARWALAALVRRAAVRDIGQIRKRNCEYTPAGAKRPTPRASIAARPLPLPRFVPGSPRRRQEAGSRKVVTGARCRPSLTGRSDAFQKDRRHG